MSLRLLLFDVDGTLAETEEGHRAAWNATFAHFGFDWHWDFNTYRDLLQIAGGAERLRHFAPADLSDETIRAMHRAKNARYREAMAAGEIGLRPGVRQLIDAARARDVALGIATTTSRGNVEALIEGTLGRAALGWFSVIACAEDAPEKKPDPQVYRVALARLGIEGADAWAVEDSRNGIIAAVAAGIRVVLTPSLYMAGDDPRGAALVLDDLAAVAPEELLDQLGAG